MSLLNDMLRDLADKHQVPDGAEGYDQNLLQSSSLAKKPNTIFAGFWLKICLVFIVVFALVSGLNYVWHKNKKNPEAAPTKAIAQTSSAASSPSTAPAAQPVNVAPKAVTNVELQERVADLLQQAERAMGSERLTAPVEDNAYNYYQKVLALAPGNEQAKQGLYRIAGFFVLKAQEQSQLGNAQQAEVFLQRAKFIAPDYFLDGKVEMPVPPQTREPEPVAESPDVLPSASYAESSSAPPIKSEKVKTLEVAEASKMEVKPNAGFRDEQTVQQAKTLVQQGREVEAIALLKNTIVSSTAAERSAMFLAELYIQQGNTQAAEILLEHIDYLPAPTATRLKAQILASQGNYSGAVLLLEQHLAAAEDDEDYRSLLAGMYHKSANYSQSLVTYQRLLQRFGDKPAYWLGLALAYDGLAQPTNALQAYLRLRDFPQLQAQVKTYVDQRIAALQSVR